MARAQERHQRRARGERLEAAAVAAAADRAVLVDEHVPDLPGRAAVPVVRAAVDDQAGADARGHLHVGGRAGVAPGAERDLGERAEVGVVVEVDRDPDPALDTPRRRRRRPSPRGSGSGAARRGRGRPAPRSAMPTPSTRSRSTPASSSTCVDQLARLLERVGRRRGPRPGGRSPRPARCGPGRSPRRGSCRGRSRCPPRPRPTGRAPAARPGAPLAAGRRERRAPRRGRGRCSSPIERRDRRPRQARLRAMSARLAVPSSRRASTMRNLLSSRRDSSDPAMAASLFDPRGFVKASDKRRGSVPRPRINLAGPVAQLVRAADS